MGGINVAYKMALDQEKIKCDTGGQTLRPKYGQSS